MKKNVLKSSMLVMGLTIVAKLVGFLKSIVQASYYGSNQLTDAFNMASGVVCDVIYMLTTAIAFAFVPIYINKKKTHGIDLTKRSTSIIVTKLGIMTIGLSMLLVIIAPILMKVVAPTYIGNQLEITILFFRIMIIGVFFSLETNVYQNILNAEKIFGFSAFASIINSITLILFILVGYKTIGIYALVFSVPCSFLFQFAFLYIKGYKYGKITLKYGIRDKTINILMLQALPILISNATLQINQAVDRALLASVKVGAVTAVSYSAILYQFVANIIGIPISSVIYTELSEKGADKDYAGIKRCLSSVIKILFLICIPIMVLIYFFSGDVVEIIYGHGNYTEEAIVQTTEGLTFYGLCILPVAIKQVLTEAFYSLNDMKKPMIIGILEVIVNIVFSIVLAPIWGISGVVGATAIASVLFIVVLYITFSKKYITVFEKYDIREFVNSFGALVVCVITCICFGKIDSGYTIINFVIRVVGIFMVDFLYLYVTKNNSLMGVCMMIKGKIGSEKRSNDE